MSFTRSLFLTTITIATACAIATSLDIIERAPTNQCCSSLISATSPAVSPILLLLGIVVPPIGGQIGVCCKSISTSTCADDCDEGKAVSCAAVTPSVLGIDIGAGCTPLPPCPPCNKIGTNTSDLFGANMGNAFNDLSAVAGKGTLTTTTAPSIQTIFVRHGSVIDGIAVTYAEGNTQTTISHGTSQTANGPTNTAVILNANETIISVAGVSGTRAPHGLRITQLKFEIRDSGTNATRIVGPFGTASGTTFNVTGTGPLLALGGFAIDTNSSLAELNGAPGGLYGLTFITSTGLDCPVAV